MLSLSHDRQQVKVKGLISRSNIKKSFRGRLGGSRKQSFGWRLALADAEVYAVLTGDQPPRDIYCGAGSHSLATRLSPAGILEKMCPARLRWHLSRHPLDKRSLVRVPTATRLAHLLHIMGRGLAASLGLKLKSQTFRTTVSHLLVF